MVERAWGISKKFGGLPLARRKALGVAAALALWAFFLWRAILVFGPSTDVNNIAFNSDSAIPVLMSNDERPLTIFNLYYYGADRWGAWPFVLTQLARRATGYRWTDQSLFVMQTLWLFVGALVFASLGGRDRWAALVAYLFALCLHTESRLQIFELSQLYAWQTGALLCGWYGLRRLFESYARPVGERSALKSAAWLSLVFASSFLAVWSSQASALFLFSLLSLEALRARVKGREQEERASRRALKPYLLSFAAVAAAVACELLQKWNYHRHALKHYGQDFATHFKFDSGHLAENFAAQFAHLTKLSWWPLYLLPTLGLLALVCCFAYAFLTRRTGLLGKLRSALAEDTLILAAGAYAIAAVNFTLTFLVDHVRLNDYGDRFLTLTNLFGPASGLLTIFLLVKFAAAPSRLAGCARPAFLLVLTILLAFKFPAQSRSTEYELNREAALTLAQRAPRGLLMGGYWETYVFAGLQPENTLTAVPVEGQEVRMPWTKAEVRRAGQIVVAYRRAEPWAAVAPAERLEQYGNSLRLVDAKWYETPWFIFALYHNETQ